MTRRRPEEESSLELLLDTICNAFGGILFLTILVAVLLRLVGPAPSNEPVQEEAHQNMVRLEEELIEQQIRLETLSKATAEHDRARQQLANKAREKAQREGEISTQVLERIAKLRIENDQLNVQRAKQMAKLAGLQKEVENNQAKVRELEKALSGAELELSKKAQTLQEEKAARTKSAKLPSPQLAVTRQVVLIVRYNEVFKPYVEDDYAFTEAVNLEEFVVIEETTTGVTISPRVGKGVSMLEKEQLRKAVTAKLKGKSPTNNHVVIAIWDDSYEHFADLKDVLIELGFKYRLIPCESGSKISKGYVPNPQVQ